MTDENVRFTGLRIRGPNRHRRDAAYCAANSEGIQVRASGAKIDNCELSHWTRSIRLNRYATAAEVSHNHIHHNLRHGLGYGVSIDRVYPEVTANVFDWSRHAIASTGRIAGSTIRKKIRHQPAPSISAASSCD